MKDIQKRLCLHGGALVVATGLIMAMATSRIEADVFTLLGSVDVQLRFASGMPAVDKQGQPLTARDTMIADAERHLATVERLQPGMAMAAEFRGFAHMLRGNFAEAAAAYGRARQCKDCTAEQFDVLAFNQARMLAKAGRGEQALAVFAENGKTIDARWPAQRSIEEAQILRSLGRSGDAERRLDAVMSASSVEPMAALQAGIEYEQLGNLAKAESVLGGVSAAVPIADYHLARLKLRQGDADRALELLGRAVAAVPAEVRQQVLNEPAAWLALAGNSRFQELTSLCSATPGR